MHIGRKLQEERKYHKEAEGEKEESNEIHHNIKTERGTFWGVEGEPERGGAGRGKQKEVQQRECTSVS